MERVVGGKKMSGTKRVEGGRREARTGGRMAEESGWMRSEESAADQQQARGWGWREVEGSHPDGKVFWQAAPELGRNRSQQ